MCIRAEMFASVSPPFSLCTLWSVVACVDLFVSMCIGSIFGTQCHVQ